MSDTDTSFSDSNEFHLFDLIIRWKWSKKKLKQMVRKWKKQVMQIKEIFMHTQFVFCLLLLSFDATVMQMLKIIANFQKIWHYKVKLWQCNCSLISGVFSNNLNCLTIYTLKCVQGETFKCKIDHFCKGFFMITVIKVFNWFNAFQFKLLCIPSEHISVLHLSNN